MVKQDHQKIQCQKQQQMRSKAYPVFPLSPDQGVEAELKSPGRPQSARNSPVIGSGAARHTIPEENLYNLFQLAEVSLAASGGSEFRNVLERWRHQQGLASRVLKSSAVKILDMTADPVLDKPLDLSRDPAAPSTEVLMLTPSPSPTPSEARLTSINIGLPKNLPQSSVGSEDDEEEDEELDATDSCWSPDDAASCKSVSLVKGPSSSPDVHECSDCGKRYSTSSNLARHRQTHRSPADQKVFHGQTPIKNPINILFTSNFRTFPNPGQTVPPLRQSLRVGTCFLDARPHPQSRLQVFVLRQVLLQAVVVAGPHSDAYR